MRDYRLALLNKGAAAAGEQWQKVSGQSGDIKPERLDTPRRRCGKCLASIGSDTLAPKFGRNALIEPAYADGLAGDDYRNVLRGGGGSRPEPAHAPAPPPPPTPPRPRPVPNPSSFPP